MSPPSPATRITPGLADAPSSVEAFSIAGNEASDDWVLIATACAGATARANRPRLTRPPIMPIG